MLEKEASSLAKLSELSQKNIAVSFSGGKDSLVVLDLAYRVGFRRAVFVDTTIEFDETTRYLESMGEFYGIKIDTVRAPIDFFEMVEHIGIPSRRFRWCCDVFKFGPLAKYAVEKGLEGFITGLRREESNKRLGYRDIDRNPLVPVAQINPILDWTCCDIWEYIAANALPVNPLYKYFERIGCWCCPFRTDGESRQIKELFPDKVQRFENTLLDFAKKMNIKDTDMFVRGRGWTRWLSPLKKRSIGNYSPCQHGNRGEIDLIFSGENPEQIKRITKILPILTEDFFTIGNRLRVTVKDSDRRRLNVLVEKAINCIGCGACLTLCRVGALHVDEESIFIDDAKCTRCQRCLVSSSSNLRGSCIVRNYSPKRVSLAGSSLDQ